MYRHIDIKVVGQIDGYIDIRRDVYFNYTMCLFSDIT